MREYIGQYIRNCHSCRRAKPTTHGTYGVFRSLPIPQLPWKDVFNGLRIMAAPKQWPGPYISYRGEANQNATPGPLRHNNRHMPHRQTIPTAYLETPRAPHTHHVRPKHSIHIQVLDRAMQGVEDRSPNVDRLPPRNGRTIGETKRSHGAIPTLLRLLPAI